MQTIYYKHPSVDSLCFTEVNKIFKNKNLKAAATTQDRSYHECQSHPGPFIYSLYTHDIQRMFVFHILHIGVVRFCIGVLKNNNVLKITHKKTHTQQQQQLLGASGCRVVDEEGAASCMLPW